MQPPAVEVVKAPDAPKATQVSGSVGVPVFLKGAGKWEINPSLANAVLIPTVDGAAFVASQSGLYSLICYVDKGASWVMVEVKGDKPVPPTPGPVVPPVVDDLKARMADAFKKDGSDKKAAVSLSAFYSEEVGQKIARDTKYATPREVMAAIRVSAVLDITKLPETRRVIASEVAKFSPDVPLTKETRESMAKLFAAIESNLDTLSQ